MSNTPFSFNIGTTPAPDATGGGLFGSLTSTPAAQPAQSLFGSSLTTPQQPAATTGFGSGFGAKPATSIFGSTFGASTTTTAAAPATTTASPFSFGQQQQKPLTTGGFGGFGTSAATTSTPAQPATNIFSGGFGQQQQQQQQQQPQQQSSLFSFNKPAQTTQLQQSQLNTSGLNQTALNTTIQATPPTNLSDVDHLANALVSANIYNDERDLILTKWNQLQAFYGTGKIFYQNIAIDVTKDNRLSRFKTISYNCKPTYKNENGLVSLLINQKESALAANQKSITDGLHKIFNSEPSLEVKIDSMKACDDDSKTELVFYVEQRVPNTEQRNRVPSMLVFNHLNKQEAASGGAPFLGQLKTTATVKQQLDQLNVLNCYPLVGLTDEQMKKYLDTPPLGFNPLLWEQAKKQNPNAKKLLPVQIIGFQEINKRFKLQNKENQSQKLSLNSINDKIEALNSRNKLLQAKIEQFKLRNEDLEQRILKVLINYEIRRKIGIPLQDNERYLLAVLESFQIELNSPINKEIQRQKLSEFLETIKSIENSQRVQCKMQQELKAANQLSEMSNLGEVQKSLRDQQKAFKSLIEIINVDLKDLNLIKQGLYYEK